MTLIQRMALSFACAQSLEPGDHAVYVHSLAPVLFRKADDGSRWVTLHPGGNPDSYVRVLIRQNKDGTAHVLSGGEGLRGLKLTTTPRKLGLCAF